MKALHWRRARSRDRVSRFRDCLLLAGVFVVLLFVYLAIAWGVLEPLGYYGTVEQPRFQDPWIARVETILQGELLYRDVYTTTPPLINYLLIPPVMVAKAVGMRNPWATLSFMVYFALFDLFTAWALYLGTDDRRVGFEQAIWFLANPVTMGNAVLSRQDESILAFFFALALLAARRQKLVRSGLAIGLGLLIKLSAALMIPVSFLNQRDWRYLVIPLAVFGLVFAPFYFSAGHTAVFWDLSQDHTEHPFQFGGISLGWLWVRGHGEPAGAILWAHSTALIFGVFLVLAMLAWRPGGVFRDLSILLGAVLLLSPKAHAGYFVLLALALAPLVSRYRIRIPFLVFGVLVMLASMMKFPLRAYDLGFILMVANSLVLGAALVRVYQRSVDCGDARTGLWGDIHRCYRRWKRKDEIEDTP